MRSAPRITGFALAAVMLLGVIATAAVQQVVVPKGTELNLVFDQVLSSKTAKIGDTVKFHVANPVVVGGRTIIAKNTRVNGVISDLEKKKRYGVNAKMRIALSPVKSTYGEYIPLEPRSTNKVLGGKQTGKAARVGAGGAIVAGPIGLVGGLFVTGKQVSIKAGEILPTDVAKTTVLRR